MGGPANGMGFPPGGMQMGMNGDAGGNMAGYRMLQEFEFEI